MWPFNDTAMGSLIYALQALCLYCPAVLLVGDVHLNPKSALETTACRRFCNIVAELTWIQSVQAPVGKEI